MNPSTEVAVRVLFNPLFWWVGLPLLLAALALMVGTPVWLYRRLTRHRLRSRDVAARRVLDALRRGESAPPFRLYLRPFVFYNRGGLLLTGGKRGRNRYGQRTGSFIERLGEALVGSPEDHIEEAIARGFHKDDLPLVALGHARNLGGGKIALPDREWRGGALLLMRHAHQIILIPSYRAGTLWEIEQLIALDALDRTLCAMPPYLGRHDAEDWNELARTLHFLGIRLPPYARRDGVHFFKFERGPVVPAAGPPPAGRPNG